MPLNIPNYHQSTETLHIGCEKPRAYFVPFPCGCASKNAERGESTFFKSLCGEWNFKFFKSVNDVCDLSTDGCFTLGATVGAVVAISGHPYLSIPAAMAW